MKNLIKIGCALVLGLSSNLSFAADWKFLGVAGEGYNIEIDPKSIGQVTESPYQKYKKIWMRGVITKDAVKAGSSKGDYYKVLYWFDCNAKTVGMKSGISYKANNDLIFDQTTPSNKVNMKNIQSDQVGYTLFNIVCQ